jgi:superfamily I DNA/RNA helicase
VSSVTGDFVPAVYGRDETGALLRESAAEFGLEIAVEGRGREADPWAMSLSRLSRALERYRLGGYGDTSVSSDRDDIGEELLRPLSTAYEALLQRHQAVDFPAMLTSPLRLFSTEPRALRLLQDSYRFAMADEFQDTVR